jgi:uncharacterized protein YndB with AHSA1/START domain
MKSEFRIERSFDASRQRVWDAWTTPDQLGRWFGPKGVKTSVETFDFRPGGVLLACMDSPDSNRMWAKFVYREIVAPIRLVWEHGFADEAGEFTASPFGGPWPLRLLTTVLFTDDGAGTRVKLTWSPLEASPEEEVAFAAMIESMTGGWTGSFDQLDTFLREMAT